MTSAEREEVKLYFGDQSERPKRFDQGIQEAHSDGIFGVPIFVYRGELFGGQDRIPLLEEGLSESGRGS